MQVYFLAIISQYNKSYINLMASASTDNTNQTKNPWSCFSCVLKQEKKIQIWISWFNQYITVLMKRNGNDKVQDSNYFSFMNESSRRHLLGWVIYESLLEFENDECEVRE